MKNQLLTISIFLLCVATAVHSQQLTIVKDIGFANAAIGSPVEFKNCLFFAADDQNSGPNYAGKELWKTNTLGTDAFLVKDIFPGTVSNNPQSSNPTELTVVNDQLFFVATNGTGSSTRYGFELYVSDGTSAGTKIVKDINTSGSSNPTSLTNVNGILYFVADDGVNGKELWKSDGTDAGTVMVKDITPGSTSTTDNTPNLLKNVAGTLYFVVGTTAEGIELWKSDGTDAGTIMVKDINPGPSSSNPSGYTIMNGVIYFAANGGSSNGGREIWKSDGTEAGTELFKDINLGADDSNPLYFTPINGTLFFSASNGATNNGQEVWKSDGTDAGTIMVFDIVTGTGGSQPMNFCAVGNKLYFTATSPSFGNEVLVTEGLTGTTKLVTNVTGSLNPTLLTNVSGMLFFIGKEVGNTFNVLYACNGKSSTQITGCKNVTNIAYANSKVYAVGEGVLFIGTTGVELFVTNSCPTPPKPIDNTSSDNLAICPGLSTTLEIESRKGIIGWYSAATGGTYLGTGLTYTTPVLTTSKSFFVQDSICGASARLEIKVTVYDSVPAPNNVTTSANLKVCKNGSTTLLASGSGLGYITWYDAAVGGDIVETGNSFTTPALTATTTYYAEDRVCDLGSRRTAFKVEVSNISATITSQTNIVCNGQTNGSATISPTGGFAGYTYSWSPFGGTAATATGLAKGTYICTIKDTKNCSNTKEVVITEPTALAILLNSQINVKCNGETNGSATVAGSGGTAPYTYLWSNGGETTSSITNKGVGTYTCTVKDAKLCTQTKAITITQPNQITSVVSAKTDPVCNGLATGTATITVAGGTTPYTYAWDNGAGTSKTITNRSAGTYTCIIKDKNNCEKTQQVVLVEPSAIIPSISSQTNPTCFGESSGSATVTATGGTPGYTYSWSPGGETGATITNKADGTYTCTIKDSKQCTKTQEVVLVQPPFINRGITITLGGTKFTVDEVDATYQWFNCDNNQQIPGANQRSYVSTTSSGRFKVRITKNGCTVESECVDMNSAGLDDLQVNVMEVYPNPSTGEFTIEIPFNATVKITNMLGQEVYFNSVTNGTTLINLTGLTKGVYNIKATSEEGENYLERVVID